jgi:malonyl-CoA/methylmalonyl-CoA synthetase
VGAHIFGAVRNLTQFFAPWLTSTADRPALQFGDRTLTFGQLDARANRMARELASRGVGPGDRVCVQLPNGIEFLDLFLACSRLGAVLVPINVLYTERELNHIVGDAEPRMTVLPRNASELASSAAARSSDRLPDDCGPATPALIIYTSGTTGAPKGAVLTHANLIANAQNCVDAWRITADDRYLAVLPLFHVHGLANGVCSWLATGCTMRLEERFDHRTAAAVFREFRPTLFFGVPTIYHRLLDPSVVSDADARQIGRTMRLVVSGSAPLPAHVLDAFRARYGHVILERYGMSEALMIATNPYEGERRAGSVGHPFPGVQVRIAGDASELQLTSPALFPGYWNDASATAAAFDGEWFKTGDVATISDDGYITLRGRIGDLIISGGFNIYPREIEDVLLNIPGVREAAVVGKSDERRGEVPVAYIVTDRAIDSSALDAHCREQLASFKVPRAFHRVDSLPRTPMGKVQKHLL